MAEERVREFHVVISADHRGLAMLETAIALAKLRRLRLLARILEDQRLEAAATLPFTRLTSYRGMSEGFDVDVTRRMMRHFRSRAERRLHELASQLEWRWAEPGTASGGSEDACEIQAVPFAEIEGTCGTCGRITLAECGGRGGVCVLDEGGGTGVGVAVELALALKKPLRIVTSGGHLASVEAALERMRAARLPSELVVLDSATPDTLARAVIAGRPAYLILDSTADREGRGALLRALSLHQGLPEPQTSS
jgi:hypothetical protein